MILLKNERIYLYEDSSEIYIDCYAVDDKRHGLRDGILIIPGGGYTEVCMDIEGERTALAYVARGVNAFVLNYIGESDKDCSSCLERAVLAMAYLKAHAEEYSVNPDRIFALGYSAGGHLCGSLATKHKLVEATLALLENSARPHGIVMCYPVVSAFMPTHRPSFESLLGRPYSELCDEEKRLHSIECNVTEETCPAFIWHTAEDKPVPVHNSLRLATAYADSGVPFTLRIYPYGPHATCLGTDFTTAGANHPDRIQPMLQGWLDDSVEWMKTVK